MKSNKLIAAALTALAVAVSGSSAGDLNPPPGPVAPSGKTLTEVEPRIVINQTNTPGGAAATFVISAPGSYYLEGNVDGESGKDGIVISTSGVTVDLNGFRMRGVAGAGDAVSVTNFANNVVIRNGHITQWPENGIAAMIDSGRIENLTITLCGGWGIDNAAASFTTNIVDCEVAFNGSILPNTGGIRTGGPSVVDGCQVHGNAGIGIHAASSICNVSGCTVTESTSHGISTSGGALIENCVSSANGGSGIVAGSGSSILNCSARVNVGNGIQAGENCSVAHCTATNSLNGDGFNLGNNGTASDCVASANAGDGFEAVDANLSDCTAAGNGANGFFFRQFNAVSRISGCVANLNSNAGFLFEAPTTAENCASSRNQQEGFFSIFPCNIIGCQADRNISTGIEFGENSSVRDSAATANESGIRVGINSRVVGSSASFNQNEGIRVDNHGVAENCISNENFGAGITLGGNASALNNVVKINAGPAITIFLPGASTCKIIGNTMGSNGSGIVLPAGTNNHTVLKNTGQGINNASAGSTVGPLNDLNNPWSNFTL